MHNSIPDKYFRIAFDNSLTAHLITRPDGTIACANQAACEMFGRSEEELFQIGRRGLVDINDPRLPRALKERDERGEVSVELNFIRKSGEIFPVHVLSKVFEDENGDRWTIMNINDLTIEKLNRSIIDKLHEDTIYLANHDYLTETLNRRGFMDYLLKELARSEREKNNCGIAILDIDHFKHINDAHGHIVGDNILIHVVKRLKESLRPYDIIGRYGGDEFILCLPHLDQASANIIGERLRKDIEQNPYIYENTSVNLTISIGIKLISSIDIKKIDANGLLSDVDNLLYKAKQHRNTCRISD